MTRTTVVAAAAATIALAAPTAASAHHVTTGTARCDNAGITATVGFNSFNDSNKPIAWTAKLDTAPWKSGSYTFTGPNGTLTITAPGVPGTHTIAFNATWPGKTEGNNGAAAYTVTCPTPPPVVTPPVVAPPVAAPPADVPVETAPPVETTPPVAVPAPKPKAKHHRKSQARHCDRRYSTRKHRMVAVCPRKTRTIRPHFTG
jgi:hypothetical protein